MIIPVYNVENYLSKCIKSILRQSYKNLEIILVDDGSNDTSFSICNSFIVKDKRIKLYHTNNLGLSHARNVGLNHANGKYIVFIDSDDYVHKDMISIMMHKIGNADMLICNYEKVTDNNDGLILQDSKMLKDDTWSLKQFWQYYYFDDLRAFCCVAWNKLYKKDLFDNVRYPLNRIHEDEYVIGKIVNKCKKIKVIGNTLYYYVQRPNSIMHQSYHGNFEIAEALLGRYNNLRKLNSVKILNENLNEIPGLLVTGLDETHGQGKGKERYFFLRKKYNFILKQYLKKQFSIKLYLKYLLLLTPRFYYFIIKLHKNNFNIRR